MNEMTKRQTDEWTGFHMTSDMEWQATANHQTQPEWALSPPTEKDKTNGFNRRSPLQHTLVAEHVTQGIPHATHL